MDGASVACALHDVDGPPLARLVLRRLASQWRHGSLTVDLPGRPGAVRIGLRGTGPEVRWRLRDWRAARRLLFGGDIGLADGYLAGDWDTPDLTALLTGFAGNYEGLARRLRGIPLSREVQGLLHALNRNTRSGARRNILAHYDLGNDFYGAWLDAGMTYSSAIFETPDESLEVAQRCKYERLAHMAGIGRDSRVLEIGCGWGGFAEYAAGELGAHVTAITLSPSQKAFAEARLFRAGLSERVDVRLLDYRDINGEYDNLISIEMFEAVGEAYWPTFFKQIARLLKPGGRAGLQVITIRDDLFEDYRRRPDFIQLEVFPGGMLASDARLAREVARSGLHMDPISARHGADYATTLEHWRLRFEQNWPAIGRLGFDERFHRLWRYYLAYCEVGFRTGRTDVVHLTLARP